MFMGVSSCSVLLLAYGAHRSNTRGTCPFRHLSMPFCRGKRSASDQDLGNQYCMGGPCTVTYSLVSCNTPSWSATTIRTGNRGVFHSIHKNTYGLLYGVSLYLLWYISFPLKFSFRFVIISCFGLGLLSPKFLVRWLTIKRLRSASDHSSSFL